MPINLKECAPECTECIRAYIKKHKLRKGDSFEIPCSGIPKQYISEDVLSQYSDPDVLISIYDPVVWAAKYLDWHCLDPDGKVWERKTKEGKLNSQFPPFDEEKARLGKSPFHRPYQAISLRCLHGDTDVFMGDGTVKKIKDIKIGDKVITYNEGRKKTQYTYKVINKFSNGFKEIFKITLANGDILKTTSNHPILSWFHCGKLNKLVDKKSFKRVYKSIDDGLSVGDKVYTLNKFDRFGNIDNDDMAKLLGYIVTDGYVGNSGIKGDKHCLTFSNIRKEYVIEFSNLVYKLFGLTTDIKYFPEKISEDGTHHNEYWSVGYFNRNTKLLTFLRLIGCFDKYSREISILKYAFNLSEKSLKYFINRCWSGDGCVYSKENVLQNGNISYKTMLSLCSGNYKFLELYRLLLKKIGIYSSHIYKDKKEGKSKGIVLIISRIEDIETFFNYCGYIYGKEDQSSFALKETAKRNHYRRHGKNRVLSRTKIVDIEYLGKEEVWDIEVQTRHNFIANGIVVHNCTSKRKLYLWGRQLGKCLVSGTLIQMSDGTLKKIENIKEGEKVICIDNNYKTVSSEAYLSCNGEKDVYKLTLSDGRSIEASDNHPFLVRRNLGRKTIDKKRKRVFSDEWVDLKDLNEGDLVAVPKNIFNVDNFSLGDKEFEKLVITGALISDGNITNDNCRFTNDNQIILEYLNSCIGQMDCSLKNYSCDSEIQFHIVPNKSFSENKVKTWLKEIGIYGLDSHEKFIPDCIMKLPNNKISIILSIMYGCDGWASVSKNGTAEIGYSTTSDLLAEQIISLLSRFGIYATKSRKISSCNGKLFESNQISIFRKDSISLFRKFIGIIGKTENLNNVYKESQKKIISNKNTVHQENDVVFIKVKSKIYSGKKTTWDLSVPRYKNFIANNIIVHNSEGLVISALHGLFTNDNYKIITLAPFQSQIDMLFSRIPELLERNPNLYNSIKRMVKAPHYTIELNSGSYIKGFSAGTRSKGEAGSVRGQPAHRLLMDEADYLSAEDVNAVAAVITNFPNAEVVMSSTPTGRRENFYNTYHGKIYKSFHYSSKVNPMWSEDLEKYFRSQLTELGYEREIEANFGEQEEGVYQNRYIEMCQDNYEYSNMKPDPRWTYSFGVDWNDVKIGTVIVITGFNPANHLYYIVDKHIVSKAGWTQTAAMQKIVELNRMWRPEFIYIDKGFGHCVGPETIIYEQNKANYIKNIKPGDNVLTHKGIFKNVVSVIKAPKKRAFELKPSKCIKTIISGDHPFLTYRTENRFKDEIFLEKNLKWRNIQKIDKNKDFIAIAKSKTPNKKDEIIDILDFIDNKTNLKWDDNYIWSINSNDPQEENSINKLSKEYNCGCATISRMKRNIKNNKKLTKLQKDIWNKMKIDKEDNIFERKLLKFRRFFSLADPDFQLIVGWFLSEGNINKATIELSQKNKMDKFSCVIKAAKKLFPSISTYIRKDGLKRLFITGHIISSFFEKFCGKYSDNKYINPLFNGLDWKYLIQGIIYGDGHILKNIKCNGFQLSMTSFHLIMTLRQYFIDRDILPSLYFCKKRKEYYKQQIRIDISGNTEILNKLREITGIDFLEDKNRIFRRQYIITDNYILVSIGHIKDIGERDDLLDLEVKDIHSFHGNGFIVHNCQNEILHGFGADAMANKDIPKIWNNDARLAKIVKSYDFGGSIEIRDLFTKKPVKKPAKPFLVENAVRKFERNELRFPRSDQKLFDCLSGYVIKNISQSGTPVYGTINEQAGDHLVDALNLSLIGFTLEGSALGKPKYITDIAFSGQFGESPNKTAERTSTSSRKDENLISEERVGRTEYIGSSPSVFGTRVPAVSSKIRERRIWSWPGFLKDKPPPQRRRASSSRSLISRPQRKNI